MQKHLEIVKRQFGRDRYAKSLGIVLDKLTEDAVQMHMELRDDMLNFFKRPHGGAIYSLADAAFSVLGNNRNNLSLALDCSITYHENPPPKGTLIVEGETLSTGRRTAVFFFKVYTEKGGARTLVATMKSVSYRTGKPIDSSIEE